MNITNIYADPDCPDCNGTGERDSGGTHPWGEPIYLACDCVDAQIGKRWRTNSSLENWFPLTAEKLGQLSSDLEDAQGEIRALRATEAGLLDRLAAVEADRAQRVPDVEDLKDRLVAISSAVADSDDREAQAIIRTTLELLASTPAPAQQEPRIPAEFDVRSILLSISPWEDGMGHEVYAASVADVEGLLTSMGQELEEWQLGIRRLPTAAHQEPPQPVERKPMTDEQIIYAYCQASKIDGLVSAFKAGAQLAERHHGIRE